MSSFYAASEGVARMPEHASSDDDDDNTEDESQLLPSPAKNVKIVDESAWEGRIIMPMEEEYGGNVVEQDIVQWCKPQFKKIKIFFSPEYKPSDPESYWKLKEDIKASSLKDGFSVASKGKRGKNNCSELMFCSRGRKDIGKPGQKRARTSKGCCKFIFYIFRDDEYDRYYIKGGTGHPYHTLHGRESASASAPAIRPAVRDPHWPPLQVSREMRWKTHSGFVVWLTGLSGSGKSTIANEAEYILNQEKGMKTYTLDGDEIRKGLCRDLGFDRMGRKENIRRVGETAKLMADAGNVVFCAFVSPYRVDREFVRLTCEAAGIAFFEIYVKADLEVCERRDPKGHYVKARAGLLGGLTGIGSPYEEPLQPDLTLDSGSKKSRARHLAKKLVEWLESTGRVQFPLNTSGYLHADMKRPASVGGPFSASEI